jgi:hypothetical protein
MQLELIKGTFSEKEALDILTQMIQVKIRFHENKIAQHSSEEDIKYRESRLKHLQHELAAIRNALLQQNGPLQINAIIHLETKKYEYETAAALAS